MRKYWVVVAVGNKSSVSNLGDISFYVLFLFWNSLCIFIVSGCCSVIRDSFCFKIGTEVFMSVKLVLPMFLSSFFKRTLSL